MRIFTNERPAGTTCKSLQVRFTLFVGYLLTAMPKPLDSKRLKSLTDCEACAQSSFRSIYE